MDSNILQVQVLSRESVQRIHDASLTVLARVGVKVSYRPALEILAAAGAQVDFDSERVRIPADLVEKCLATAPSRFSLCGRVSVHDMELDGTGERHSVYVGTLGSAPYVYDLEAGQRRTGTLADLAAFARLTDALKNMQYFHVMVMPGDVEPEMLALKRWACTFRNLTKHAMTAAGYIPGDVKLVAELAGAVVGGTENLKSRPIFSATECPTAPLQFGARAAENIVELARLSVPVIIYSEPMSGATSPVTLAGTLVITNAEVLAGLVLMQLVNPGCPVIYGSVASVFDMKAANVAFGSPETGLFNMATTAMARYYGLPNLTTGGRCDSKVVDAQAGMEKSRNLMLAVMAGSCLNNMGGTLEGNLAVSYAQLVVDDEIAGQMRRVLSGISVAEEDLALELIEQVGVGGNYLGCKHTLAKLKEQHYLPSLSERLTYGDWLRAGAKDMGRRAQERAAELIRDHVVEPLPDEVERELDRIIRTAARARGLA